MKFACDGCMEFYDLPNFWMFCPGCGEDCLKEVEE